MQGVPAVNGVTLTWAKADHFWFRKAVTGGNVWLTVDAVHGVKEPLFDHQRLAIELNLRSGYEFTPLTLPFTDPAFEFAVKYDGSNAYIQEGALAVEFIMDATFWRCELQVKWDWNKVPPTDYECLPRGPRRPGSRPQLDPRAPVASPDGTLEAFVDGVNVAVRPRGGAGPARALSSDGSPEQPYQPGSIRWSRDSTTLTAWRVNRDVWQSTSITSNVKSLVARGEWSIAPAVLPAK